MDIMEHMCLLFELECPECGGVNGHLAEVVASGRKYACPDCNATWHDLKFILEDAAIGNQKDSEQTD